MKKKILYLLLPLLLFVMLLVILANATNPYADPTLIEKSYSTQINNGEQIDLFKVKQPTISNSLPAGILASLNENVRNVYYLLVPEKAVQGNEESIIRSIHAENFDPDKPYLASGRYASDYSLSDFGTAYNAVMDRRTALDKKDWENRQRIYLQSIALNLELLQLAGRTYAPVAPVTGTTFIFTNTYTGPADTLFGVLYGLRALTDEVFIQGMYASSAPHLFPLQTKGAGSDLLKTYRKNLNSIISDYYNSVIDPQTGLIQSDVVSYGKRDAHTNHSSFYNNVIVWATMKHAMDLGIIDRQIDFDAWKSKIISTFWEDEGFFTQVVSGDTTPIKVFSADSFIVTGSGFFDPDDPQDKEKLVKMISYVQKNKLDSPIPLHSSADTIESHWGMEYIKVLILLSADTLSYKELARYHLDTYKAKIEQYGGYPEFYDKDGNVYKTIFYTSGLQTSWVVNYEQARMMYDSL